MRQDVILQTKIRPPLPRDNGIARDRLARRLTEALNGRLTLVCAPAGFGKTTLLSQWARQSPAPVAWFSIDETDDDLMKFWRTFVRSVAPFVSPALPERLEPLLLAYPNATIRSILDILLSELEEKAPDRLAIVLDDYHSLTDASIHDSLAYAIDHLPDRVHLTISSRTEPPVSTAKWNARGQRLDLSAKQLSFTPEETGRFCRDSAGLALSDERIGQLMRWTEGWAASLQLISLRLSEHDDPERFFDQYRGDDRNLMQYLFEEVFGHLPGELRTFLLRTSALSRFDAPACDALALTGNAGRVLEELRKRNLLLSPLDDAGIWYRYHHLLSLFLRNRLQAEEPGLWPELNRLAALHFAGRGLMDEAIEHALAAGDSAMAAGLLAGHVQTVLRNGELATLLRWMGQLPPEAVPHSLALLHSFVLIVTGQFERARAELSRLERVAEGLEGDDAREIQSGLFFVKINLAFSTGDYDQWYAYAERLPDMLPKSPIFYYLNYNTNEPLVRRTVFGLRGEQPPGIEAISHRIVSILDSRGWGHSLFAQYIVQSVAEGYYEWDRLRDGEELLRRVEPVARRQRIGGLFVPNRIMLSRLRWAEGNREGAFEALEEAAEEVRDYPDADHWLSVLGAARAYLQIREGNLAQTEKELNRLRLQPEKPTLFRVMEYTTLARLLGARRKEKEALQLLETLMRLNKREGSLIGMAEVAALRALIEAQRGYRGAAFGYLEQALDIGRPNGYVRTFLDEGAPMLSLLRQYRDYRLKQRTGLAGEPEEAALGYVSDLLARFAPKEPPIDRAALPEPLTAKERAVLLEAVRGAVNREIAERLHLTEGTVKVYLSRVYAKLGVSSRIQALHRAEELRLFELE
ncbi:hypothetical protein J19TS2_30510 [Cohnella xylanilytica]|uniref:LuxR C-terminal-related transcriptional regulator n=1 Tax=Cohnella xylanilytica TaxID=557555 RepID=UPI001B1CA2B2|nr:LuxR C-terminal-related transcriptional regulator [Cohnella xylanilytica]GIO13496.1 hypothetical protein J19TS2_30510 [Cohnella xylanilytica]